MTNDFVQLEIWKMMKDVCFLSLPLAKCGGWWWWRCQSALGFFYFFCLFFFSGGFKMFRIFSCSPWFSHDHVIMGVQKTNRFWVFLSGIETTNSRWSLYIEPRCHPELLKSTPSRPRLLGLSRRQVYLQRVDTLVQQFDCEQIWKKVGETWRQSYTPPEN